MKKTVISQLTNKMMALGLVGIGVVLVLIERDATFLVFGLMVGIPLFFSKKNWIE